MSVHSGNEGTDARPGPTQSVRIARPVALIVAVLLAGGVAIGIYWNYQLNPGSGKGSAIVQEDPERERLWDLVLADKACIDPDGEIVEYEGSEYSHKTSYGDCLTDLEFKLQEGTACRLDDDTIVPLDDKYITRDRSKMCLTKADIAESQQLVDEFVAFVGAQADKTWPDKASALVTEYCQSEDKRAMLRTLEHRTTVFDAFDAAYSKGQVYSGLPRHFDEAVYEWCDIMSPSLRDSQPPQNGPRPQVTPTVTP